jgi:CheY-like chemotaxis protein
VLLIEDNLANLKMIQALVQERAGMGLVPAMTGRLGLELAREHRLDLILLDQHLPDIPGAEVLQRLKANPPRRAPPVVIVSADATPGRRRRMLELGAAAYVTKPIDVPRVPRAARSAPRALRVFPVGRRIGNDAFRVGVVGRPADPVSEGQRLSHNPTTLPSLSLK